MGITTRGDLSAYDSLVQAAFGVNAQTSFPVVKRSPPQKVNVSPWLQKGSLSPYIEHGENDHIWENRSALTKQEIARFSTPQGIADLNREGIGLALDRRVALFFQQSILCYNTPFIFSTQGADDQIGTAQKIHLSNQGKKGGIVHKREAAHSSTIPTLLAQVKNDPQKRTFVYLKGGSSHAQHNATIGMHIAVNGADELLDGKGQKGLRASAIKILNQVADGLDPIQATKTFLQKFENRAAAVAENLEADDPRKAVLEAYVAGIEGIGAKAETDPAFFDHLIGVNIRPNDPDEAILRKTIYQRRYEIIRLQEVVESRIGKRIDTAKQEMGSREGSLLEHTLLKEFAETGQRKILEKLFAKTAAIFEEEYRDQLSSKEKTSHKSFQTQVKNLRENYPTLLDHLKRDLRREFRKLSSSEMAYRAQVFKDLRTRVRDWTQKEFCEQYHQSTGKKIYQAWVSRVEQPTRINTQLTYRTPLDQRTRPITLEDAQDCACAFKVDAGLLLPCLFTSDP